MVDFYSEAPEFLEILWNTVFSSFSGYQQRSYGDLCFPLTLPSSLSLSCFFPIPGGEGHARATRKTRSSGILQGMASDLSNHPYPYLSTDPESQRLHQLPLTFSTCILYMYFLLLKYKKLKVRFSKRKKNQEEMFCWTNGMPVPQQFSHCGKKWSEMGALRYPLQWLCGPLNQSVLHLHHGNREHKFDWFAIGSRFKCLLLSEEWRRIPLVLSFKFIAAIQIKLQCTYFRSE